MGRSSGISGKGEKRRCLAKELAVGEAGNGGATLAQGARTGAGAEPEGAEGAEGGETGGTEGEEQQGAAGTATRELTDVPKGTAAAKELGRGIETGGGGSSSIGPRLRNQARASFLGGVISRS